MTVRELEEAVKRMLDEAASPSPDNRLTAAEVRTNVGEYLDELDDALSRAPARKDAPRWTLWMMDADDAAPATFAVAVVSKERARLCAGHGDADALKAFQEEGFKGEADAVVDALAQAFPLSPTRIEVPRLTLNAWANYEP